MMSSNVCSARIWQLYLLYVALAIFECGVGPMPSCRLVSQWFDRHRGLALGLMMCGVGFGALIMPSVAQYLIVSFGWRSTFSIVGSAILLFTVPILVKFLKDKPESTVLAHDRDSILLPLQHVAELKCALKSLASRLGIEIKASPD
jgi:MFS family permease